MADLEAYYRQHLNAEFTKRKTRNPRYSIRAFAKALNIDNGFLSKLLSGKILLSLDLADKISNRLKLSSEERSAFLISAIEEQKCHALYLLEPNLTECDEKLHETNLLPKTKNKT